MPNPSESWLITGATGQLGGDLLYQLADTAAPRVVGLSRSAPSDDAKMLRVDLADATALRAAIAEVAPSIIVHAGAVTSVAEAAEHPARAEAVNIEATRVIVEAARRNGMRLVYISTDMVFDGDAAPYRESDPPRPLSKYGETKLAAERVVQDLPGALVLRLPLLFGFPANGRETTFTKQIAALRAGSPLNLFTDEFRTPAWLPDAARAVLGLARSTAAGVLHCAGAERVSRFELVERCAALLKLDTGCLRAVSRLEIPGPPRPADLSLDDARLRAAFPALGCGGLRPEVFASRAG